MKKLAFFVFLGLFQIVPPAYAYNIYYGNLHAHCSFSDGIGTPSQAYQYARDTANVDVQALTDHTHMLTSSEYSNIVWTASQYTEDGVFVALAGQEHGSLSTTHPGAFGHMNFFESTSLIPQYDNGGTDYRYNLSGTYSWLINHTDGILGAPLYAVFNHPYETGGCGADAQFHDFAYSVTGDSAMSLTEIRNGRRSESYEQEYFEVLAKGWHVGVTANQDNHEGHWGDQPNPYSGGDIYLTGILADTLTKEAILVALKDRRTFAMEVNPESDRMGLFFLCEGHWMGDIFETSEDTLNFDITVWGENDFISLELIRNGIQVDYVSPGTNYFEWHPEDDPPMGESYYFVRAQQVDGDYLWSSPIWVTSTGSGWNAISEVNEDNENGEPVLLGQQVTIKGVVTVGTGTFSTANNDIFVQDATGGVNVLKRFSTSPWLSVGDSITVVGIVDQYNGLTRISSPTITVEATGLTPPEPRLVTTGEIEANGEIYEGLLVKLQACTITSGTWPPEGSDGLLTIDDGSGECTLFIDSDTNIDGSAEPPVRFDVVGVITQYDNSLPYTSGYRIVPRSTDDILPASGVVEVPQLREVARVIPNPAKEALRIVFDQALVSTPKVITIFDVQGRRISSGQVEAGEPFFTWKPVDSSGRALPGGIYFVLIESDGFEATLKVVVLP